MELDDPPLINELPLDDITVLTLESPSPEVKLEPDVLPDEEDGPEITDPALKNSPKLAPEEKHPAQS